MTDNCKVIQKAKTSEIEGDTDGNYILWHRRYGHISKQNLDKLKKGNMVKGIDNFTNQSLNCIDCTRGKQNKKSFPTFETGNRKYEPLDLIHTDLCGKISPLSLGGASYFLIFVDDKTKYLWVYPLRSKSESFEKFRLWKLQIENQINRRIKILRSDNGGEFCGFNFEKFLMEEGIIHQKTIPKTPEQNGVAERYMQTICNKVRSMLSDSKLPQQYWAEALMTAAYIINRSPSASLENVTPYEALYGVKPSVKHFRVFGSLCEIHIPREERNKFDFKTERGIFTGYSSEVKG